MRRDKATAFLPGIAPPEKKERRPRSLSPTGFLCRKACRAFLLEEAKSSRAHKFTRVSMDTLRQLSAAGHERPGQTNAKQGAHDMNELDFGQAPDATRAAMPRQEAAARASGGSQHVTFECGFCNKRVRAVVAHWEVVKCVCGKYHWALEPKRGGPYVMSPHPELNSLGKVAA